MMTEVNEKERESLQELMRLTEIRLKEHLSTAMILDRKAGLLIAAGVSLIGFLFSLENDICGAFCAQYFFVIRTILVLFLLSASFVALFVMGVTALFVPGTSPDRVKSFLKDKSPIVEIQKDTLNEYLRISVETEKACLRKAKLVKLATRLISAGAVSAVLFVLVWDGCA